MFSFAMYSVCGYMRYNSVICYPHRYDPFDSSPCGTYQHVVHSLVFIARWLQRYQHHMFHLSHGGPVCWQFSVIYKQITCNSDAMELEVFIRNNKDKKKHSIITICVQANPLYKLLNKVIFSIYVFFSSQL